MLRTLIPRFFFFLLCWILFQLPAHAQIMLDQISHSACGTPPAFKGGIDALNNYFTEKLLYPDSAKQAKHEGGVLVQFTLDSKGRVKDARVIRPLGFGCDQEALRLVSKMPRWIPARTAGKKVPVVVVMPVLFFLDQEPELP